MRAIARDEGLSWLAVRDDRRSAPRSSPAQRSTSTCTSRARAATSCRPRIRRAARGCTSPRPMRRGAVLFESGALRPDGAIVGNDNDADATRFEPHYDEIRSPDQVQIYESIMVDQRGRVTTGLLRALTLREGQSAAAARLRQDDGGPRDRRARRRRAGSELHGRRRHRALPARSRASARGRRARHGRAHVPDHRLSLGRESPRLRCARNPALRALLRRERGRLRRASSRAPPSTCADGPCSTPPRGFLDRRLGRAHSFVP